MGPVRLGQLPRAREGMSPHLTPSTDSQPLCGGVQRGNRSCRVTSASSRAAPVTQPGDLIPILGGAHVRVTYAKLQRRPRSDGKGDFGFVLVFTEPTSSDQR